MAAANELWHLYARLVQARMRSEMQYKASFIMRTIGAFFITIIDFAGIVVLFSRIPQLAGWSLMEVGILYGLTAICFATAELFAASLDWFDEFIIQGTFDRVLTRPLGALFQVLTEGLTLRRLGRISQGALVLAVALHTLPIHWTLVKVLLLAFTFPSGIALFFGIFVIGAAYCFWVVQGKEATHVLTYGGDVVSSYPLEVYRQWLRKIITFVLPIAFVSYYPTLYLLDRPDPLGLPEWMHLAGPLAALAVDALAYVAWTVGVRRYQSTGT